jgi:stage V sporulation protein G
MCNKIEVVRLNRLEGDGTLKAFCDISLFDAFLVKGVKVVNGKKGLFVSMPQTQGKDGKWYDNFRPLNGEVRQAIQASVLEAYAA